VHASFGSSGLNGGVLPALTSLMMSETNGGRRTLNDIAGIVSNCPSSRLWSSLVT